MVPGGLHEYTTYAVAAVGSERVMSVSTNRFADVKLGYARVTFGLTSVYGPPGASAVAACTCMVWMFMFTKARIRLTK